MTAPWLGHRDQCPTSWRGECNCPCPSCGVDLDTPPPKSCPQFAHQNVTAQQKYGEYLPKEDG